MASSRTSSSSSSSFSSSSASSAGAERRSGGAGSTGDAAAFQEAAEKTAARQRDLQAQQDRKDNKDNKGGKQQPPEQGAGKQAQGEQGGKDSTSKAAPGPGREEPQPPMPRQHLKKPGLEADMQLKPRFEAPHYQGSGKLKGFSTLITGGDSGIGRAVAVLFAREGANVAIVYLNEHEDAEATRAHVEREGGRCLLIPGDVKDAAFCRSAVAQTVEAFGGLQVLVNNAAFQEHAQRLEDLTEERFDHTFRTNVYGYFHMAQAALPHMERGAAIVNTGSVTGLNGSKHLLDYSTTKGAIHSFTKALAANLAPRGIRVNAVAPGPVWTPLNPADQSPEDIAEFGQKTDLGRPAQPEELSPAYVFLAAPCCSSYITGMVLPITGSAGDGD